MIRYIIVDDEPLARKAIALMAANHSQLECAGQFNSATTALDFLETNTVDLVFLDINMPGLTGLEMSRKIKDDCMIIFTTAYSEYAAESYEVDAIDYLVKPIQPIRFAHAVSKAEDFFNKTTSDDVVPQVPEPTKEWFFVKADRRNHRVMFDDILYVQGLKDYVVIQTKSQRLITHMNLSTISKVLPDNKFLRVSKSYIVNIDRIDSYDNNDVYIGEFVVPIGTAYRNDLIESLS